MAKKESKTQGVLSLVADFVSTFITAVIVIVAVAIVVMRLMGWNMYSVDSYSMTPAYPINSLIVVKPVEPETIQVGDVITYVFNEDGVLVTHRVTEIDRNNETFTTKGDANESEDASPVLWGNVVGKVILGIPGLGSPLRVLTSEDNRPVVIGVIAGLFVLSFVWDFVSGRRKKRKAGDAETAEGLPDAEEAPLPEEVTASADSGDDVDVDVEIEYIDVDDISREFSTEDKSPGTDFAGEGNNKE